MANTPNLNLQKFSPTDYADVSVINSNWDKIDSQYGIFNGQRWYNLTADMGGNGAFQSIFTIPVAANKVYFVEFNAVISAVASVNNVPTLKAAYLSGALEDTTVSSVSYVWPTGTVTAVQTASTNAACPAVAATSSNYPLRGLFIIKSTANGTVAIQFSGNASTLIKVSTSAVVQVF